MEELLKSSVKERLALLETLESHDSCSPLSDMHDARTALESAIETAEKATSRRAKATPFSL